MFTHFFAISYPNVHFLKKGYLLLEYFNVFDNTYIYIYFSVLEPGAGDPSHFRGEAKVGKWLKEGLKEEDKISVPQN